MITNEAEPRRTMVRFLLGEVSEQERARFEDAYIKDTDLFQHLVELENDLIDLYALGALSPSERKRLEHSFLADPERRKRLAFARTLSTYPDRETPILANNEAARCARWLRTWSRPIKVTIPAAAVFLLALFAGFASLLVANHNVRMEIAASHKEQETTSQRAASLQRQVDTLTQELDARGHTEESLSRTASPDQRLVSFTLMADALRGNGEISNLKIPSTASLIELRLVFSTDPFPNYDITMETPKGDPVWHKEHVRSQPAGATSKVIAINLPARMLKTGDYNLRVTAKNGHEIEDVAGYSFRVMHP
jgi:hypothetical protein